MGKNPGKMMRNGLGSEVLYITEPVNNSILPPIIDPKQN